MQGTWTYDERETTDLDKVRGLLGDVDVTDQLISDEKITAAITSQGSVVGAAIYCAESLAAQYARYADKRMGQSMLSASQMSAQFEKLALRLRANLALSSTPYLGGQSKMDKTSYENDTDRVEPFFTRQSFAPPGLPPETLTETADEP